MTKVPSLMTRNVFVGKMKMLAELRSEFRWEKQPTALKFIYSDQSRELCQFTI